MVTKKFLRSNSFKNQNIFKTVSRKRSGFFMPECKILNGFSNRFYAKNTFAYRIAFPVSLSTTLPLQICANKK